MTAKKIIHSMWDFPMAIFNTAREKIAKIIADRAIADERWLNG